MRKSNGGVCGAGNLCPRKSGAKAKPAIKLPRHCVSRLWYDPETKMSVFVLITTMAIVRRFFEYLRDTALCQSRVKGLLGRSHISI